MKANPKIKSVTLTTRQTLSQQHKQNLKSVKLISYQDIETLTNKQTVTFCLHNLEKVKRLRRRRDSQL